MNSSTHYQAGRDWAQSASLDTIRRAQRLARVANDSTNPSVLLRMLFSPSDTERRAERIAQHFDGQPTLETALEFTRGAGDTDPRPVSMTA